MRFLCSGRLTRTLLPCNLRSCGQPHATPPQCRYREAVYSFQAAVRVQAADPLAHFRIGNALFALKKYADARKVRGGAGANAGSGWGCFGRVGGSPRGDLLCRQVQPSFRPCVKPFPPHVSTHFTVPVQAYGRALKCCKPGVDDALQPKVRPASQAACSTVMRETAGSVLRLLCWLRQSPTIP